MVEADASPPTTHHPGLARDTALRRFTEGTGHTTAERLTESGGWLKTQLLASACVVHPPNRHGGHIVHTNYVTTMTIRSRDRQRAEANRRRHANITPSKSSTTKYTQKQPTAQQLAFRDLVAEGIPPDVAKIIAYSE